jgi:hypothetical protein
MSPARVIVRRVALWRSFAAFQTSSLSIRRGRNFLAIHSTSGFSREMRLPVRRLKRPAVSSWSRLKRSNDSASTTSNRRFNASRINAWKPERSRAAPEIA